jgi:hypothetical protein
MGGSPSLPPVPPVPPAPATPAPSSAAEDVKAEEAAAQEKVKLMRRKGRPSTVLTGGAGLTDTVAPAGQKTLLGQ